MRKKLWFLKQMFQCQYTMLNKLLWSEYLSCYINRVIEETVERSRMFSREWSVKLIFYRIKIDKDLYQTKVVHNQIGVRMIDCIYIRLYLYSIVFIFFPLRHKKDISFRSVGVNQIRTRTRTRTGRKTGTGATRIKSVRSDLLKKNCWKCRVHILID